MCNMNRFRVDQVCNELGIETTAPKKTLGSVLNTRSSSCREFIRIAKERPLCRIVVSIIL